MAEFKEVMRQLKRMCNECGVECAGCPMYFTSGCYFERVICEKNPASFELDKCIEIERMVMDWAAAHPEPRYPSWAEAWRQLFPDAMENHPPCPRYFMGGKRTDEYCIGKCAECKKRPILADIAEKLRIKPIGGTEDA